MNCLHKEVLKYKTHYFCESVRFSLSVFRRNGEGTVFIGVCLFTPGIPTLDGGTYPGWGGGGVSTLDMGEGYSGVSPRDRDTSIRLDGRYSAPPPPQETEPLSLAFTQEVFLVIFCIFFTAGGGDTRTRGTNRLIILFAFTIIETSGYDNSMVTSVSYLEITRIVSVADG